jgi:HAD superfamily hydrolase (TIGR01458 family)
MTSNSIKGLLLDLDGVLMTGGQPLPGAVDTLNTLRRAGVPFLIVSNVTLHPRRLILKRFASYGVDLPLTAMLTPPAAAAEWLRQPGCQPVAAFVTPATREEFDGLDLLPPGAGRGAASVVIGDMGDEWNAAELNRALRLLLSGARLLTLGLGRYWMAPDGLRLDSGAFTAALAYAAGQQPVVFGKPAPEYFDLALSRLGLPPGQVAMIGDDVFNDVDAAQRHGLSGALVQTGKFRPADLERGVTPRWVLPDIRGVLPLLGMA